MNKLILSNVGGLLLIKSLTMGAALAIIPIYIEIFNSDSKALGNWLAFFSFLTILQNFDFGVLSTLKNKLIAPSFVNDSSERHLIIRAGLISLLIIGCCLSIIFIVIAILFFGLNYKAISNDIFLLFIVTSIFLLIFFPFKISIPILQSLQRNGLAGVAISAPQLIIFGVVFVFYLAGLEGSTLHLLIFYIACCLFFYIAFFFYFTYLPFKIPHRLSKNLIDRIRPSIKLLKSSLWFFSVQLSLIFIFYSNEVFYILLDTPDLVVRYQYYYRWYSLFFVGFSLISLPFWSSMRQAVVDSCDTEVRNLTKFLLFLLFITFLAIFVFSYNFQFVLDIWLGRNFYVVEFSILLMFNLMACCICLNLAVSTVLNSLNIIKGQALVLIFAGFVKLVIILMYRNDLFIISDYDVVILSSVVSGCIATVLLVIMTRRELKRFL